MDQRKAELVSLIDRFTATDGIHTTAVPRVTLIRAARPTEPLHVIQGSAICIVAQGRKQVMLGPRVYTYDSSTFIVSSVDVPVVGQVIEASQDKPYLCFVLSLDPAMLSALMLEAGVAGPTGAPSLAFALSDVTPELLDATNRLLWLLASPRDIPVLAPLAEREILYRLLRDEANPKLREIALADSKLTQVNRAISWIKQNYREPLRIEDVAQEARMSPSALHAHFKAITTMSPLQYQKQLRLQEARRLILAGAFDAAAAGHRVGYKAPRSSAASTGGCSGRRPPATSRGSKPCRRTASSRFSFSGLFRRLACLDKLPRQRTRCARFLVFQLDHSEFPDEVLYFVTGFPRLSVTAIDPQGLRTELSRLLVN